ncbi:hypothetical protein L195_g002406 [Trifolium pratense]|nr:hypothetical protein L195_g002406 [Trifolium pratense]
MRLSQLALVPYDKDEKRPTTRGESDSAANKRRAPFEETKFGPSPSHAPYHEQLGWLRERER